jgi:PAS domain S-box-containing protein
MDNTDNNDIFRMKLLFDSGENTDSFQRRLTDFFPAIVYVYDSGNKRIQYINKKVTEVLGYSYEDIKSWNDDVFNLIFKDDVEQVKKELDKYESLKDEDDYSFNCRLNHKKGDWRYFRTQGTILRRDESGKPSSLLFIAQDITDNFELTEKNRKLEELFSETQEMLQYGMWDWNIKKNTVNWSDGLYKLLDYDEKEKQTVQLTSALFDSHIVQEDQSRVVTAKQQYIKDKKDYELYYAIVSHQGITKNIHEKGKMVCDDKGEVEKVIGSTRDITDQLKVQDQLMEHKKGMESVIKDLNRSNKELEEFAYIASHDLQEPLRKLSTFSERLVSKYSDMLDQDGKLYIQRILAATENMRVLIDNLLEFSRTTRPTTPFTKTNLNDILRNVTFTLEAGIEKNNAAISVAQPLPTLEAVPSQMEQLFGNLVGNAIKFHRPEAKVDINISTTLLSPSEVAGLNLPADKRYHKITVSDNGIGFEQEYAERIFQIFQRLHGKVEFPGSGVGLAICKKIVENHGGVIFAEGVVNQGAVFYVILPENQ